MKKWKDQSPYKVAECHISRVPESLILQNAQEKLDLQTVSFKVEGWVEEYQERR